MKHGILSTAFCLAGALAAGCASTPAAEEGKKSLTIRTFQEDRLPLEAQARQLGVTAAAVLAEQFARDEDFFLVLPAESLEQTRLAWERRAEDTSVPIPVKEGDAEANVQGTVWMDGGSLFASAVFCEDDLERRAEVRGPLGNLKGNKVLFRELALRLLKALKPGDPRVLVRLGITLREQGLVPQAVETYQEAIRADPKMAAAHYNLGVAYDALGDIPSAVAAYRRAVAANPAHLYARYNWALDEMRRLEAGESRADFLARVGAASERLRQIIARDARTRHAHFLLVEALSILGKYSEALEACERIKHIFPADGHAFEVHGNLLLTLERFESAAVQFRKAAELEPGLVTNVYFLGRALEGMGRKEEAASTYREFMGRSAGDPKFEQARRDAARRMEAIQAERKAGEASSPGGG